MSLKYDFFLNEKVIDFEPIERLLKEKNIPYSKKADDRRIYFDAYEDLGFEICIFRENTSYFEYQINDTCHAYEWNDCTCVSFEVNKFFDNQKVKSNMLEMIIALFKSNAFDALLLFNGDVLILDRKNGKISPDLKSGFWKSNDLLTRLEH